MKNENGPSQTEARKEVRKAPSASYSITMRVRIDNKVGMIGEVISAIGRAGGDVGAIDIVQATGVHVIRDITVDAASVEHSQEIVDHVGELPGVEVVNVSDRTFLLHLGGKIKTENKAPLKTRADLSMAYTPGVARVCMAIHDDQHGAAIVVLAALINALRIVNKKTEDLKVVFSGVGAAGVACSKILMRAGVRKIVGCDHQGAIYRGRESGMNFMKNWYAENTNPDDERGSIHDVIRGADVFIGLSAPGMITTVDLKQMGAGPIVFALANPTPEIMPEEAAPYVRVMANEIIVRKNSEYPHCYRTCQSRRGRPADRNHRRRN